MVFLQTISAQVVISNLTPYIQDFNTLPVSGQRVWADNQTLPGWYATLNGSPVDSIAANTGTVSTPGFYSLGNNAQTDRALGGFAETPNSYLEYGIRLVNNTGTTIRNLAVSYTLEQWYRSTAASEALAFSYQTGSNLTSLSAGKWTAATALGASSPAAGSTGTCNGNLAENQVLVKAMLYNVDLAPGQEIILKWQDARANRKTEDHGMGIDDLRIAPVTIMTFYAKASGFLNALNTWGINPDGSGLKPQNFTAANQVFLIHNNPNPSINGSWTVSGENSKVVLGDGLNPVNLHIQPKFSFQGLIDLNNQATLNLENTTLPTLGTLQPNSSLVLNTTQDHALQATSLGHLTLAGAGTKSLSGPTTVTGSLTLNGGKLALRDHNLRLAPGVAITGGSASSFVLTNGTGALEREVPANNGSVSFPVGNPTYTPAELSQATSAITDYFRVRLLPGAFAAYDEQDQPLGNQLEEKAINRTWIVDEETAGGSDLTLHLFWSEGEVLPNYKNQENQISHCDKGTWTKTLPKAALESPGSMYSNSMSGITTFSPFISNTPDARLVDLATLPVELLSFSGTRRQQQVVLQWTTAMEKDNDFFAVEVSADGRNFREAGRVKGAGNSQQMHHYAFTHPSNTQALLYFRLKQSDLNGKFTYSPLVAVSGSPAMAPSLQVYPNPGTGFYRVDLPKGEEALQAQVSDLSGKLVLPLQPLSFTRGQATLDLRSQPAGIYLLTLARGETRQLVRLVKN